MNQQEFRVIEQINSNLEKMTSSIKALSDTIHKDNTATTTNSTTHKIATALDKINDTLVKTSKSLEDKLDVTNSMLKEVASKLDNK